MLSLYFLFVNVIYLITYSFGAYHEIVEVQEFDKDDISRTLKTNSLPEITILVPAYNEAESILNCIDNLHSISFVQKKIIIINDGSTDNTLSLLIEHFKMVPCPLYFDSIIETKPIRGVYKSRDALYSELLVIDKENGLKQDALNAGINATTTSHLITIDADTLIDDYQFKASLRELFLYPDTIAIGAGVSISNECGFSYHKISTEGFPQSYFVAMEGLEYLRCFLMRQGFNYFGGNFCISGAFAFFKREALVNVYGFGPTFANDMEIIIKLQRYYRANKIPFKITYLSEPIAWTDGPTNFKSLGHQRMLWHRGLLECLWFHKTIFYNPRYGGFGIFIFPLAVFCEAFEPVVEFLGYLYLIFGFCLGLIGWHFLMVVIFISWGCSLVFSLFALTIEEYTYRRYSSMRSSLKLLMYAFLENFGYRQMTIFWRLHGFISFFQRFDEIKRDAKMINERFKQHV